MTALTQLSAEQIESLPLDRLGLAVLEHCEKSGEWNTHNFLINAQQRGLHDRALLCLSEAMNWLIAEGLIARDKPGQSSGQSMFVTRAGKHVLQHGMRGVVAAARLGDGRFVAQGLAAAS